MIVLVSFLHACTVRINGSQVFIYTGIFLLVCFETSVLTNEPWSFSMS